MFEKQKAALAANDDYQKAKLHVQRNKKTYMGIAGGFVLGGVVFHSAPQVKNIVDAYKIQIASPTTNVVTTQLVRRHNPGIKTLNKITGEPAASISRMAAMDGVSRQFIKDHSTGPNAIYQLLGEME